MSNRIAVKDRTSTHYRARWGYWAVFCYEYCWAYRPAVVDDYGNLVRVDTGKAHMWVHS